MLKVDNQPIDARVGGDAVWITDFITPNNPDILLKYNELTAGLTDPDDIAVALWHYISHQPYVPLIFARLNVLGKTFQQKDTWFYPGESLQIGKGNCANKSFVLASLLKNYYRVPGQVFCAMGNITLDGIGAHAWVELNNSAGRFIIETTQPNLEHALIPKEAAIAYDAKVYFDERDVYVNGQGISAPQALSAHFGVCAVPWLENYLCQKCLTLEG